MNIPVVDLLLSNEEEDDVQTWVECLTTDYQEKAKKLYEKRELNLKELNESQEKEQHIIKEIEDKKNEFKKEMCIL